jgi:hypothetical protein
MYGSILTGKAVNGSEDANTGRGIDFVREAESSELVLAILHNVAF